MHAWRMQEGMHRKIYVVRAFMHVYNLVSIETLTSTLKKFVKCSHKCKDICDMLIKISGYLWHYRKNVRILSDVKLFTRRIPYINTLQYYCQRICVDRQFNFYVTFLYSYLRKIQIRYF